VSGRFALAHAIVGDRLALRGVGALAKGLGALHYWPHWSPHG